MATITAEPPAADRDITVRTVQVVPDGKRLSDLVHLLARGVLTVQVAPGFQLERAARRWLGQARRPRLSHRAAP
jgi:hypothetical protein